jgi:hypothetical protein
MKTPLLLVAATFCLLPQLRAQTHADAAARASLSAGMGVEYASYSDVTGLINVTALASERVPEFKSAVEFFGAFALPLSDLWLLKFEYAYTLASWSPQGAFGPAAFSVATHMPSVILPYLLPPRGVHPARGGAGGGYHFGSLGEKYLSLDDTFNGKGAGMVFELEANTAFGDHLFAFLGGNLRWEFIGGLLDGSGVSPGVASGGSGVTLHSFGVGARLGACYLF